MSLLLLVSSYQSAGQSNMFLSDPLLHFRLTKSLEARHLKQHN